MGVGMVLMGTSVHNSLFDNMFYEILTEDISFDQKMEEIAKILPQILRYPDKASARILFGPYKSPGFKQGKYQISSSHISTNEEKGHVLCLELFYNNLSLKNNYTPFNSDEKQKLDFIAKILSIFIDKEVEVKKARHDYDFLLAVQMKFHIPSTVTEKLSIFHPRFKNTVCVLNK